MKQKREAILAASDASYADIAGLSQGGKYASGLASEGYAGGYHAALQDVLLLLNGTMPTTRNYWNRKLERTSR